jgi:hypothetical protein
MCSLLYRKYPRAEASFQKTGTEMELHRTGSLPARLENRTVQYRRALTAAPLSYFYNLIEEKNNPTFIFDTVATLTKKQYSTREDGFHFSSDVLLLNSDKTEMLVLGPKKQRDLLLDLTINLDGCTVFSNITAKDLGVTLDPDLSFD